MPEPEGKEGKGKGDGGGATHVIGPLALMTLLVLIGTAAYEAAKQRVFPDITLWESHGMTIFFTGAVAAAIVYSMLRRQRALCLKAIEELSGRRRAEAAQQESEEKYRTLFEESKDAIFITSQQGAFLDFNQAMLELFGYTREEMFRLDTREVYANPLDRQRFQQEIEQKEAVRDYEVKFRRKDGVDLDCLLTATVRSDSDGNVLGYQGIVRDITEQRRAEKVLREAEQVRVLAETAGAVAHEINQPLSVLLGTIEMMMEGELEDVLRGQIASLNRAAQRIDEIVRQMGAAQQYVTKPYLDNLHIVDFDGASNRQ